MNRFIARQSLLAAIVVSLEPPLNPQISLVNLVMWLKYFVTIGQMSLNVLFCQIFCLSLVTIWKLVKLKTIRDPQKLH